MNISLRNTARGVLLLPAQGGGGPQCLLIPAQRQTALNRCLLEGRYETVGGRVLLLVGYGYRATRERGLLKLQFIGRTAQPFRHDPHDLQGEDWGALHEEEEVLPGDGGQQAVSAGNGAGAARFVIDEHQFAHNPAWPYSFDDLVMGHDIDLTFHDDEHAIACFTDLENPLASSEGARFLDFAEEVGIFHWAVPRGAVDRSERRAPRIRALAGRLTCAMIKISLTDFDRW